MSRNLAASPGDQCNTEHMIALCQALLIEAWGLSRDAYLGVYVGLGVQGVGVHVGLQKAHSRLGTAASCNL